MLPAYADVRSYLEGRGQDEPFAAAVLQLAARHHLNGPFKRAADGFHVVFLGNDRVVKLFAPFASVDFALERTALAQVAGRLPVATPAVCAEGQIDGWSYLITTRLSGRAAIEIWPQLDAAQHERLVAQLGTLAAALHEIPLDEDSELAIDWSAYMHERRVSMLEKHRQRGVDARWLAEIEHFVDDLRPVSSWPVRRVFLHNDLHPGHVHVDRDGNLSGLLDFGDVQYGAAEVEFTSIGGFVSPLFPRAMSTFLRAYGYPASALTPGFARRLTGYVLLHRYCDIVPLLRRFPASVRPTDLATLHRRLWDFADG